MESLLFGISNTNTSMKKSYLNIKKKFQPWVEKYRPKNVEDIILDPILKTKILNFLNNSCITNMIITGHPGTGKTSTIIALAKMLYQEHYKECVIELNASDNRGLETINNSIIHFCKKKFNSTKNLPKLIILDEADNITKKAQNTLTNLIELYNDTTKFAFTCNDSDKLVEGIQTRCIILRYNSINDIDMKSKLIQICNKESIEFDDDAIDALIFIAKGDVRQAINNLESTFFGFKKLTTENVYKICEKPPEFDIKNVIQLCLDQELQSALNNIMKIKKLGYCNNDILLTIIDVLKKIEINEETKINMIESTSNTYMLVNDGVDTDLQLLRAICDIYKIVSKSS